MLDDLHDLHDLHALQQTFAQDIYQHSATGQYFSHADFSGDELIQIYRNNYFLSLISALKSTYACIYRLLGQDFFEMMAKQYIQQNPPDESFLQNYGGNFHAFIKDFPAAVELPFLPDVARLEWAYERCYYSKNAQFLLSSTYPLIKIWQLSDSSNMLNLNQGGDYIFIYKINKKVIVEKLKAKIFKQMERDNDKNIQFV